MTAALGCSGWFRAGVDFGCWGGFRFRVCWGFVGLGWA